MKRGYSGRRYWRWLIFGSGFVLLLLGGGWYWSGQAPAPDASSAGTISGSAGAPGLSPTFVLPQRPRRVYPYSVIPGGVRSPQELREYASHDQMVASHYAGFKLATARMVRLKRGRLGYVSYRIGDKIFWTQRKLRLARGEQLITDGVHYARARCGNRVSATPQEPTWPLEPPPEAFERPGLDYPPGTLPPLIPPNPAPPAFPNSTPPVSIPNAPFIIPPVIIPPLGGDAPSPGTLPETNSNPTPVTPVPEPSTVLMVTTGLAGIYTVSRGRGSIMLRAVLAQGCTIWFRTIRTIRNLGVQKIRQRP